MVCPAPRTSCKPHLWSLKHTTSYSQTRTLLCQTLWRIYPSQAKYISVHTLLIVPAYTNYTGCHKPRNDSSCPYMLLETDYNSSMHENLKQNDCYHSKTRSKHKMVPTNACLTHWHTVCKFSAKFNNLPSTEQAAITQPKQDFFFHFSSFLTVYLLFKCRSVAS